MWSSFDTTNSPDNCYYSIAFDIDVAITTDSYDTVISVQSLSDYGIQRNLSWAAITRPIHAIVGHTDDALDAMFGTSAHCLTMRDADLIQHYGQIPIYFAFLRHSALRMHFEFL